MEKIPEDLLHYIWENRLFETQDLIINNKPSEIIDTGSRNYSSGPDFFNAKIRIGETVWAGNVEIHVKASDWFLHNHQDDPSYFNVILHVVYFLDCRLERPGGEEIPSLVLKFSPEVYEKYKLLQSSPGFIPCSDFLGGINKIFWSDWFSKLMIERLEEKTLMVEEILKESKYDWEECIYRVLGKSFGFKINAYPFETLVRTTPLKTLLRARQKSLTVNAILFGQAGFLEDLISEDSYYVSLQREYHAIKGILPPRVLEKHNWKFMGTRPGNFPHLRIAQFASLVVNQFPLFAKIIEKPALGPWKELLDQSVNSYWETHYLFGKNTRRRILKMGKSAYELIILNALIPVVFHYAKFKRKQDLKDKILSILENLPPEKNRILTDWASKRVTASNAFESQALIHLSTHYCNQKRCLSCRIGRQIIKPDL